MNRFKYSLLAAAGITVLALVLTVIGPRRVMAALGFTPVREVNSPGRQPFQTIISPSASSPAITFQVPPGKRLVLTTIAALGQTGGQFVTVITQGGNVGPTAGASELFLPFTFSNATGPFGSLTGEALLFADPNSTVTVIYTGTPGTDANVSLTGYLVDVP